MEAPQLPSFIRGTRRAPRGLKYIPMYYDPDKEELEARIKSAENDLKAEKLDTKIISLRVRNRIETSNFRRDLKKRNSMQLLRLGIILVILVACTYYIFNLLDILKQ
ncbi:MAG: hypothetical protein ACI8XB_003070 [Patiriisocius sp.]|jgi:hypothetical protein